jgi:hypothetical protein
MTTERRSGATPYAEGQILRFAQNDKLHHDLATISPEVSGVISAAALHNRALQRGAGWL